MFRILTSNRVVALLVVRAIATIGASALFGLVAAAGFPPWSFLWSVLMGFLFGTAFVAGTGYRILLALARQQQIHAPASWSGASAGAALMASLLAILSPDPVHVLSGFGLAITFAYLAVKAGCCLADCCQRPLTVFGVAVGLRRFEILISCVLLVAGATLALRTPAGAGVLLIGGHLALRLYSRRKRGRTGSGWPPLCQPGAEIAPLILCLCLVIWPALA